MDAKYMKSRAIKLIKFIEYQISNMKLHISALYTKINTTGLIF